MHCTQGTQQQESQEGLIQQLKAQCSGMAAVLPFASSTVIKASSSSQAEIYYGLAKAVDVSHQPGLLAAAACGPGSSSLRSCCDKLLLSCFAAACDCLVLAHSTRVTIGCVTTAVRCTQ